jgi:hypothetical protein
VAVVVAAGAAAVVGAVVAAGAINVVGVTVVAGDGALTAGTDEVGAVAAGGYEVATTRVVVPAGVAAGAVVTGAAD